MTTEPVRTSTLTAIIWLVGLSALAQAALTVFVLIPQGARGSGLAGAAITIVLCFLISGGTQWARIVLAILLAISGLAITVLASTASEKALSAPGLIGYGHAAFGLFGLLNLFAALYLLSSPGKAATGALGQYERKKRDQYYRSLGDDRASAEPAAHEIEPVPLLEAAASAKPVKPQRTNLFKFVLWLSGVSSMLLVLFWGFIVYHSDLSPYALVIPVTALALTVLTATGRNWARILLAFSQLIICLIGIAMLVIIMQRVNVSDGRILAFIAGATLLSGTSLFAAGYLFFGSNSGKQIQNGKPTSPLTSRSS